MGGADTEIDASTTTVALEMAWFEPTGIARSVASLGLRSEASHRFERGIDPYGIDRAIARFVELLRETCPDLVVHAGAVDARGSSLPPEHRSCTVRVSEVNRILGTSLSGDDLPSLLDPIGFSVTGSGESREVSIPSWRPDSTEEIDVIEEVARMYGYDRVGQALPASPDHGRLSLVQQRRRRLREVLLGLGLTEAMPNPFLAPDTLVRAGLDGDALRITNPLVTEESVLRTSLRPGLLLAVAFNQSHRRPGVALFELGHVYPPGPGELPDEYEALGVVLAGGESPAAVAVWREVAAAMGVGARIDQSVVPPGLHPTRSATLVAGRDAIGAVGEVHPTCSTRSGSPAGSPSSSSTSPGARARAEAGAVAADESLPVDRPRPRVRRPRATCRRRRSTRRSARARATCSSTSTCSTCTAVTGSARAGAASPTACGCRRPIAP